MRRLYRPRTRSSRGKKKERKGTRRIPAHIIWGFVLRHFWVRCRRIGAETSSRRKATHFLLAQYQIVPQRQRIFEVLLFCSTYFRGRPQRLVFGVVAGTGFTHSRRFAPSTRSFNMSLRVMCYGHLLVYNCDRATVEKQLCSTAGSRESPTTMHNYLLSTPCLANSSSPPQTGRGCLSRSR